MPGRPLALPLLVAFFFAVYALIGLTRHWQFESGAYDLGLFDQLFWHLSRFEPPSSSVRGLANMFGDHFHPIILLLLPAYWLVPSPETLITAQALLFAASIVPVYLFAKAKLGAGVALVMASAYGFFWGLQRAAEFDFHEYAFAPVVIASAILAVTRRSWGCLWICAAALVLVKEDLIPVVVFLGLYLFFSGERKQGTWLAAFGLASFAVVVGWLIPRFSGNAEYGYTHAYAAVLERPWTIAAALVTPVVKLRTAFLWVAPFAMLPLASPLLLLIVPLALSRLLSASSAHWGTIFHYSAPIAPIVAMSAIDGLYRAAGYLRSLETPRWRFVVAGACVVLSAILPGQQPFWDLLKPEQYVQTAAVRTGHEIVRSLPSTASIVAQAAIIPHLAHRDAIYVLDDKAPDADFVIASTGLSSWPLASIAEITALVDARRQQGYEVLVERDGWVLLRHR